MNNSDRTQHSHQSEISELERERETLLEKIEQLKVERDRAIESRNGEHMEQ